MLSNIVQNSHQLLKSQFQQDQNLLNEVFKLKHKNKKRNFSYFQMAPKKGSIFEEPNFNNKINMDHLKKRTNNPNRTYFTSHSYRKRQLGKDTIVNYQNNELSQLLYKDKDKLQTISSFYRQTHKNSKTLNLQSQKQRKFSSFITMSLGMNNNSSINQDFSNNGPKIIHSRKNNRRSISNKNPKLHHQKTLHENIIKCKNTKLAININLSSQMINEPGFINLTFYKNTLQQIDNIKNSFSPENYKNHKQKISNQNSPRFIQSKVLNKKQSPISRTIRKQNLNKIDQKNIHLNFQTTKNKNSLNRIKYKKYHKNSSSFRSMDEQHQFNSNKNVKNNPEECRPWSPDRNHISPCLQQQTIQLSNFKSLYLQEY